MVTEITIATSDTENFEKACKEVNVKYYKKSSGTVNTSCMVIHNRENTLFLLGWMTAKNKFLK